MLAPFAEIHRAYVELLERHVISHYEKAMETLEGHLCDLWYASYLPDCEHDPFMELIRYRGAHFLHDSSCTVGIDAECRVIAALAVSQEILPLGVLLDRLMEERRAGKSIEGTTFLIDNTLTAISDGLSRSEIEAFRRAVGCALQFQLQSFSSLVERFSRSVVHWSPPSRARRAIKHISVVVNRGLEVVGEAAVRVRYEGKGSIDLSCLAPILAGAVLLESRMPKESLADLSADVLRQIPEMLNELRKRLQDPDEELIHRLRENVLPLLAGRQPRPRYLSGPRQHRLEGGQTDVGHFIAHSVGGPPDINLFQQDRKLNRGWSEQGKIYRAMEEYVSDHPGTFYFSRAIYKDSSSLPRYLEMGVLLPRHQADQIAASLLRDVNNCVRYPSLYGEGLELAWWIGVFDNCPE